MKLMKNALLILTISILAISVMPIALAKDVQVGMYLLNLGKFDIATGAFTADFYLSMKCDTNCSPENFEFANGRAAVIDKMIDKPNEKFFRIQANLVSPIDLKQFPFDEQVLEIALEDKTHKIDEINYVPLHKETGMDQSIIFPGWKIDGWSAQTAPHKYDIYNETYSQYQYKVMIGRIALNSFLKTLLPVFFIVVTVLFSFIIDPDKITTRLTMVGSSLVAAVMFHVSINNQIPPVGYLTFADKFMILTYLVLMTSFLINITLIELNEQNKKEIVEFIHRSTEYTMMIVVPILYLILFIFFI